MEKDKKSGLTGYYRRRVALAPKPTQRGFSVLPPPRTMESEDQRREAGEQREGSPTNDTLVPLASPTQMRTPQTTVDNDPHGAGCLVNPLLQNLDSKIESENQEMLRKNSERHASIRRNVYLIKKVKARAEDDGMFCSCNPSTKSTSVCGRDCLCGMLLSCCTRNCKCGPSCLNKPFQHRTTKKMKLVETEKCGSGMVAGEDIKKGEFVIEYVGEVIDDKMCEERLWKMKHSGENNFYLCEINRDTVIDATYKGNKSRYINHSCQPNTEMQKWRINGETRIGIFAIRDIRKGEELTYDYKFVQFGDDQNCHCGATSCRKKLGNKPAKDMHNGRSHSASRRLTHKRKDCYSTCIGRVVRVWCPRLKRNYGGVILEFDNFSKKHLILKDDGKFENLDLSKEDWEIF